MTDEEGAVFARVVATLFLVSAVPMTFGLSLIPIYFMWRKTVSKQTYTISKEHCDKVDTYILDTISEYNYKRYTEHEDFDKDNFSTHIPHITYKDIFWYSWHDRDYNRNAYKLTKIREEKNNNFDFIYFTKKDNNMYYDMSCTKALFGDGIYLRVIRSIKELDPSRSIDEILAELENVPTQK